jgi:hypothetical protein
MGRWKTTLIMIVAPLAWLGCPDRRPSQGHYSFLVDQVFSAGCGLATASGTLWEGDLRHSGDLLLIPLQFDSIELQGYYLVHSDHFSLDGTASQVSASVKGQACLVDWIGVHLEGDPVSDSEFDGAVQIQFDTLVTDACNCITELSYHAVLQ